MNEEQGTPWDIMIAGQCQEWYNGVGDPDATHTDSSAIRTKNKKV